MVITTSPIGGSTVEATETSTAQGVGLGAFWLDPHSGRSSPEPLTALVSAEERTCLPSR